jgi:hypothetical protein
MRASNCTVGSVDDCRCRCRLAVSADKKVLSTVRTFRRELSWNSL